MYTNEMDTSKDLCLLPGTGIGVNAISGSQNDHAKHYKNIEKAVVKKQVISIAIQCGGGSHILPKAKLPSPIVGRAFRVFGDPLNLLSSTEDKRKANLNSPMPDSAIGKLLSWNWLHVAFLPGSVETWCP